MIDSKWRVYFQKDLNPVAALSYISVALSLNLCIAKTFDKENSFICGFIFQVICTYFVH